MGGNKKRKKRNKTALVLKVCVFLLFNLSFLQKGGGLVDPQASKNVPLPPKQKKQLEVAANEILVAEVSS